MKTTTTCPVCNTEFTRVHTQHRSPTYCSRACANKAPGRMTAEVRARIGRSGAANGNYKGGTGWLVLGGVGRPYMHVNVPPHDRHLHPTVHKKGSILRSHLVWDQHHPDDPVVPGEIIHHINNDSLDDRIENLEKMPSQSPHAAHHFSQPRGPMSEAHKAAIKAAKLAKRPIPDKACERCGKHLRRDQVLAGCRFCTPACSYADRTGKPRNEWAAPGQ